MTRTRDLPRTVVALLGAIVLLATAVLVAGTTRPTEAQWMDEVHGEAVFGVDEIVGHHYARALSAFGTFTRPVSSPARIGPGHQLDTTTTSPTSAPFDSARVNYRDVGFLGLINLSVNGTTCARSDQGPLGPCPSSRPAIPSDAASFASASVDGLRISTLLGIPLARYTNTLRTTASCTPGETGTTTVESNGDLELGAWPGRTWVPIPVANEGERVATSTASHRETGLYTYTATLTHVREVGMGYAKSNMYLELRSDTTLGDNDRWTLIIDLASAECGLSRAPGEVPAYPTSGGGVQQGPNAVETRDLKLPAGVADAPKIEGGQNSDDVRDAVDPPSLEDEASGEDVRDTDGDAKPTGANSPSASVSAEPTTLPAPSDLEYSATKSRTTTSQRSGQTSSESAEPTAHSTATKGPQNPESVGVGQRFAVVTRDGVELGTARIEDVQRLGGCGIELTLSLTTSQEEGPDRWSAIGPSDFAGVSAGGAIREAQPVSADCDSTADATTTALSPGRSYQLLLRMALDDSARQVMLRSAGTAGWVVDLPPLSEVPVPEDA